MCTYNGNLRNRDFENKNISNAKFINCNLSGVNFKRAIIRSATFENCFTEKFSSINFDEADLTETKFYNCKFTNASFKNSNFNSTHIYKLDIQRSNLVGCRFSKAYIDNLNVAKCNLHLSSFIDSQILFINFNPYLKIPYLRGLNFFKNRKQIFRTIFINQNTHLEFTKWCHLEARKDKLYSKVTQYNNKIVKFIFLFAVSFFGLITNYGTSIVRWLLFVFILLVVFALLLLLNCSQINNIYEAFIYSTMSFFNIGNISISLPKFVIIESIFGYFMLGILVSLINIKIISE